MQDLRTPEKKFRPEIEGVRVFASLLVAIYHIWFGKVSGGVDVFFIVSGYLITTSLLSRIVRDDQLNIKEYYLGLLRRLWPAALTVIMSTIVLAYFIFPASRWVEYIREAIASIFYFENWQLAFNSVDYLAQNATASPFQHFWALSLQGQFYFTWPFVILLSYLIARKLFKTPVRKTLLAVLSVVFVLSLSYSIYKTNTNQPWAYFDTFARAWEFSLGGILSLLLPYLKPSKSVSLIIGWLGFAVIMLTGMVLPVSDVFPGYAALLPTTGVMLVIISAETHARFGVKQFLGHKFFLSLGSISYAFYLWHWPIYIFYLAYFNVEEVSFGAGLLIIAVSFILAFITAKWIEGPTRNLSPKTEKKKIFKAVGVFLVPALVLAIGWNVYGNYLVTEVSTDQRDYQLADEQFDSFDPETYFVNDENEALYPNSVTGIKDLPHFYSDKECYTEMLDRGVKTCSYGDVTDPDYTLALVGGSHTTHWFPAIEESAKELNIQVDLYYKDGCRFTTDDFDGGLNEQCMEWNEEIVDVLLEAKPDMIFSTATVEGDITIPKGYVNMWEKFAEDTELIMIRDNPKFPYSIPVCVEENGIEACHIAKEEVMDEGDLTETKDVQENVHLIDFTKYFCDDETCYTAADNILILRDTNHITATYSERLAVPMQQELEKVIAKLEDK